MSSQRMLSNLLHSVAKDDQSHVTYLPAFITRVFRGMPGVWKDHHRLILTWLMVMQALFPGRKTVVFHSKRTNRSHERKTQASHYRPFQV